MGADGVERVFAYDEASQLVSVTASSGEVTTFLYDGLGRRVRQEDADGAVREFAYGPTGYLSTVELGDGTEGEHTVHRIEVDALGEIVAVDGVALGWDVTAAVPVLVSVGEEVSVGVGPVTSWRVARSMGEGDPYGVPGTGGVAGADVSGAGSGGVLAGFALSADGIPVVAGIELMGARGYDPVTASFLSVDPLAPVAGAAWGSNPYSFAGNNPVMMSDPWGLRPATDADLAAYREANQGALADAGDWVADNWEYVAAGAMVVAGVALMATGVGGPVGGMLVSGGISMGMQKASTGSVDPVQLALDMVPGGLLVQGLVASGSAAYSYVRSPGPHNVAGFVGDVAVAGLGGVLPGPSVVGRQVSGAGGDAVAGAGRGFTRAPETKLVDVSSTPTEVQRREVQESLRWTPEQVEAARFDRAGVERYLNDSVMFTGPTPAMRGSGQVWTDPLGNTVRTMDGSGSGRPHDVDRIVFNTFTGGRVPMDPLTWRQAQLPGDFSKELYGMNARSYLNSASHIEFRK